MANAAEISVIERRIGMIRNVIFDIGNVLADFRPKGVLLDLGISEENAEIILDGTLRSGLWGELDRGVIPEEEVIAQMRKRVPDELGEEFVAFFGQGKKDFVEVYSYAEAWLERLKKEGFRIFVLSNYPESYFEAHRPKFTFLRHADGLVVSAYVKMVKPDPEIYRFLLKKYGLKAEECIFVDDLQENVQGANSVGIHGIQFTSYEEADRKMRQIMKAEAQAGSAEQITDAGAQTGFTRLLHGGDYNPEQWLDRPDILEKDIEMLKAAGCNAVSLGIFSWAKLEPEEGVFQFEWLEEIVERLYQNGISTILATPSGARPKWLAERYPEVLRVDGSRHRNLFGARHNHCYTSPIYREKVARINQKLSERLGSHPGVILWHISNEYGGECHCPLCQQSFRSWLEEKYQTIEHLNQCWNTTFWSHTYQSFDQIESPSQRGEMELHGLNLDWKRFVTHQTADFIRHEVQAVRKGGSTRPVTTNLMYYYSPLDYFKIAKELDLVSWDTYPTWHKQELIETAYDNGMCHDLMRSLKRKPFLQMESCPSATNWQGVSKLKRPGVLFAQSMQAIAHGGEGALYFQIRQSRGASEKFHGAVIDHYGGADTRVFKEVCRVGDALKQLSELAGSEMKSRTAIVYDWDSQWAMEDSRGPRNDGLHYKETVLKIYRAFRKKGMNVDLVDMESSISDYRVLVLPMVYMFKEGFDEQVRAFVENGGTLIATYWSGIADDTDLCYLGGTPHGLMDVLGLRSAEIDGLYDGEENQFVPVEGNCLGLTRAYTCQNLCELAVLRGAEVLMTYGSDFYQGYAALTVNRFGKGDAWYVAADAEPEFYEDFIDRLLIVHGISGAVPGKIPAGLEVTTREKDDVRYYLYQNFGTEPVQIPLPEGETESVYGDPAEALPVCGLTVLKGDRNETGKNKSIFRRKGMAV